MGRPATKTDLISAANENYEEMNRLIAMLTEKELATPFDFRQMRKRKKHIGKGIKIFGMF